LLLDNRVDGFKGNAIGIEADAFCLSDLSSEELNNLITEKLNIDQTHRSTLFPEEDY
jgi:hypothetical protein